MKAIRSRANARTLRSRKIIDSP